MGALYVQPALGIAGRFDASNRAENHGYSVLQVAVAHEEPACGRGADAWQVRFGPWLAAAAAGTENAVAAGASSDGVSAGVGSAEARISPAATGDAAVAAAARLGYWGHSAGQRLAALLALCRDALDCWQLRYPAAPLTILSSHTRLSWRLETLWDICPNAQDLQQPQREK